jgi:hypothetical protein
MLQAKNTLVHLEVKRKIFTLGFDHVTVLLKRIPILQNSLTPRLLTPGLLSSKRRFIHFSVSCLVVSV